MKECFMNTLQLIKARAVKSRAVDHARSAMARAFRNPDYTDTQHTPLIRLRKPQLRYRGVAYEPIGQQQEATGGRDLRYRGVSYGVY
ncbi:DUF4278 domain-containing protein [bacterium]|jgi:hypothetical protein|nr:DUF4278 domain-containing protein [bacterium]|tara:strand:- start:232 stop:492 length:261 start_codon:yes stop_codon:yes gene_type:complete